MTNALFPQLAAPVMRTPLQAGTWAAAAGVVSSTVCDNDCEMYTGVCFDLCLDACEANGHDCIHDYGCDHAAMVHLDTADYVYWDAACI